MCRREGRGDRGCRRCRRRPGTATSTKLALKLLTIIGIVVRPVKLTPVVIIERFVALALVPYLEDVDNFDVA